MSRPRTTRASGRHAFTLVEVLLAISVGMGLMAGIIAFLISVTHIFKDLNTAPNHDLHSGGVVRYLSHLIERAEPPEQQNNNTPNNQQGPIEWRELPDAGFGTRDPLVSFRVIEPGPLLQAEDLVPLGVRIWLMHDEDKGLFLIWQTDEQARDDPDDVQSTLLSPNVIAISYQYWDEDKEEWETMDDLLDKEEREEHLPQIIELTFRWDPEAPEEEDEKHLILLPAPPGGAPVY